MTKLSLLARRLVLLWGFAAGCGSGGTTGSDPGTPVDPGASADPADTAAVYAQLETDMRRLNNLEIVDAPTLVVVGGERSNCYGLHPCETSASDPVVAAEYARQAPRLHALVALAETAANAQSYQKATDTAADVATLNGLAIVQVTNVVKADVTHLLSIEVKKSGL